MPFILLMSLTACFLGVGPTGAMDSICFFLLVLSIWQGSRTRGQSPHDRISVGVKEKLAIPQSSESGRDSETGAQARVVQQLLASPPALQAQTEYFLPSISSPLTFALGIELSLPELSDPVGL